MVRWGRGVMDPLCLIGGALLAVGAGAAHPHLRGDAAAQLTAIAQSDVWRVIHWAFLFGFPLALTGLAGVAARHAGTPGESAARAGLSVATFAYGAWAVIVAFMAGAGWSLARRYVAADPGTAAAGAIFLYDTIRPFGLAAQRAAGFALGLATYLFGRGVLSAKVLPRWLGTGGVAAGLMAIALALVFRDDTVADEAAFVLPVLWQVATGVVLLRGVPAAC